MPLSTSSFDRIPSIPYGSLWRLTLVLVVLAVVGLEVNWRKQGHRASIIDDPTWWAIHRQAASQPDSVVLIGASRLQLGFSSQVFKERFPERPLARLEVAGRGAFEVLKDLAEDESFTGLVICSTAHSGDVGRTPMSDYLQVAHRRISLDRRLNRATAAWLRERLVFLGSEVRSVAVIRSLITTGDVPLPRYIRTSYDRSRAADFDLWRADDSPEIRQRRVIKWAYTWGIAEPQRWGKRLSEVEELVDRIGQRGGNVVFLVMPITDPFYSTSQQIYPKPRYWNRFARVTDGVPVHFRDVPALRDLQCPDSSHLDERDAPRFTEALLDELVDRGVFLSPEAQLQENPPSID